MRITIAMTDTAIVFMRRAGYGFQKETTGEAAFVRRVGGGSFPRYHAYVQERPGQLTVNLHVDQKAPTYGRNSAHSGEYEGTLVEEEAVRLRSLAQSNSGQRNDAEKPAQGGSPPKEGHSATGGKGFFGKLFG